MAMERVLNRLHLDPWLLLGLAALAAVGMVTLYSAGGGDTGLVIQHSIRLAIGFVVLAVLAQIPPQTLQRWTPWLFLASAGSLIAVLIVGETGKGAQRWLDVGLVTVQPSEFMKLILPMMVAWYFAESELPPSPRRLLVAFIVVVGPVVLIAKQPDLGTALLVGATGLFVLFLAGLGWRIMGAVVLLGAASTPVLWYTMHEYQRQRVLTFFNPESDPLGSGYHIIQSMIAVGSGGPYGKGWMNGTQSGLEFLPERSTDFVFAVIGEEFGLIGSLALLLTYLLVSMRGLYIAAMAQETYTRLLAGSLSLTFFMYVFVNTGMVIGLLPVVGVPLPLVSYGGTSMVTLLAGFGMLMSVHTHKRLLSG